MKRITIFTALLLSALSAFSQEMTAEQNAALQAKATALFPKDSAAAQDWMKKQSMSFESISYMNIDGIGEKELNSIKAQAAKKFPNEYTKQEEYITNNATAMASVAALGEGIDPKIFSEIKAVALTECADDITMFSTYVAKQLEAKKYIETLKPSDKEDPVTFAVTKQVLEKTFPYNYTKQLAELQKRTGMQESAQKQIDNKPATIDGVDPNSPGAYNVLGRKIFTKCSLKTAEQKPSVAVAVVFKGKKGILCPFSCYKPNNFDLITAGGDRPKIKGIYACKEEPVLFMEVESFPEGMQPIEIEDEHEVKKIITQPLTLAGMYSASQITCYQISIASIRDNDYLLSAKTPYSFTPGVLLIDFAKNKLISFMLVKEKKVTLTDLDNRSEALSILRRQEARTEEIRYYPRLDTLNSFEPLIPQKLKEQFEYLENLKKSNDNLYKAYTLNSFDKLRGVSIFTRAISKYEPKFFSRSDSATFNREMRSYLNDIITVMKKDIKEKNPDSFYSALKDEVRLQTQKRHLIISYFENNMRKGNVEPLIPSDVKTYRERMVRDGKRR